MKTAVGIHYTGFSINWSSAEALNLYSSAQKRRNTSFACPITLSVNKKTGVCMTRTQRSAQCGINSGAGRRWWEVEHSLREGSKGTLTTP